MGTEREVKLSASPALELPPLDGLAPGVTAVDRETRWLDAVYYDTADLRLARAGVTLRHRSGEKGPPWTLKLPGSATGSELVRAEIGFTGGPAPVPGAAADAIVAYARGSTVAPVARLRTERRVVEMRGPEGPVAEVVDDRVTVEGPPGAEPAFREVEVEALTAGPAVSRVLRAATKRLEEAGCIATPPVAKLVRALGEAATAPPDVVVADVGPDSSVLELARGAIGASVARLVSHDPGVRIGDDPEDVHQFRVAARRLRAHLATFAPVLDRPWVEGLRADLAWIGGAVGPLRDADVFAERLRALAAGLAPEDANGVQLLLDEVARRAADARSETLAAMRSPRYVALLDSLVAASSALVPAAGGDRAARRPARPDARRWIEPVWRKLARRMERLGDAPADRELHRARIAAKRCRYAAEAFIPACGKNAQRFASGIADLQTVLGDYQDTVVGEAWLRAVAESVPAAALAAGELIAAERAERRRLAGAWPAVWEAAARKRRRRWLG